MICCGVCILCAMTRSGDSDSHLVNRFLTLTPATRKLLTRTLNRPNFVKPQPPQVLGIVVSPPVVCTQSQVVGLTHIRVSELSAVSVIGAGYLQLVFVSLGRHEHENISDHRGRGLAAHYNFGPNAPFFSAALVPFCGPVARNSFSTSARNASTGPCPQVIVG
jgi:hypothetical protein